MGCIIGSLISSVACCFCSSAAGLCCPSLPSCKGSTSTRLMYLIYFSLGFIFSMIMLNINFGTILRKIPAICQPIDTSYNKISINFNFNCDYSSNYGGIYRCCFGIAIFFFIFSLLMIRVKSSTEIRAKIQNGFWFWKFLFFVGFIVSSLFLLPDPYFTSTWLVFGMIGAFLYILIQLVLIVDFSHIWNERWVAKYEDYQSIKHYYGLIGFTFLFFSLSAVLIAFMLYVFGSHAPCHLHRFFILFNTSLCLLASGISVTPKVQEHTQRSGLLQASIITVYVLILTWGALVSSPDGLCNPTIKDMLININKIDGTFIDSKKSQERNDTGIYSELKIYKLEWNYHIIITLNIFYFFIIYFSTRDSTCKTLRNSPIPMQNMESTTIALQNENKVTDGNEKLKNQLVYDDEQDGIKYDYSLFHFIYCLGVIYVQMTLTSWFSLYSDIRVLKISFVPMWVKISASWICVVLYLWTLLAPVIFPDRDFS